jgi:predicted DNA-binding transcriptional regulator YafY
MDTAERLLRLLGLLEGRIDWTADELSTRLEVTTRTIRRDITRLRDLGYPVEAVAGPGGGYRLGAGGKLPPLLLDDDEALIVALGLRVAANAAVGGLEDASLSALSKLEHVLPPRLRTRLEDISVATVSMGSGAARIDPAALATTAAATRARGRIRFDYTDAEGRQSRRHAEPLRLVHTGRRWYLVAFDLDRADWRTFRLDRVSEPVATGIRSAKRKEPDPVELVQRGIAVDAWNQRATIVLHVPAGRASASIPPTIGAIQPIDDQTSRLETGADEMIWLAHYLLGLPFAFTVEEPDELKRELSAIGARLVGEYA